MEFIKQACVQDVKPKRGKKTYKRIQITLDQEESPFSPIPKVVYLYKAYIHGVPVLVISPCRLKLDSSS